MTSEHLPLEPTTRDGPTGNRTSDRIRVFISYAWEDEEFVRRLAGDLQRAGFDVFVDRLAFAAGAPLLETIWRAISHADAVIFIVSHASERSSAVEAELARALALHETKPSVALIPIIKDRDVQPPPLLADRVWLDMSGGSYQEQLRELQRAIATPPETRMPLVDAYEVGQALGAYRTGALRQLALANSRRMSLARLLAPFAVVFALFIATYAARLSSLGGIAWIDVGFLAGMVGAFVLVLAYAVRMVLDATHDVLAEWRKIKMQGDVSGSMSDVQWREGSQKR